MVELKYYCRYFNRHLNTMRDNIYSQLEVATHTIHMMFVIYFELVFSPRGMQYVRCYGTLATLTVTSSLTYSHHHHSHTHNTWLLMLTLVVH